MEREREISKLVSVLHQIAFAERFSAWSNRQEELSKFIAQQYNRVLARLKEIDPSITNLFVELNEDTNPLVIRLAARELAGYFEEDIQTEKRERHFGRCGTKRVVVSFAPMFGGHC
jgi:hypothetical protein